MLHQATMSKLDEQIAILAKNFALAVVEAIRNASLQEVMSLGTEPVKRKRGRPKKIQAA